RLPEPRPSDLFFDMESDPFYESEGLEYLFGLTRMEGEEPVFRSLWAHDRREEKLAFEAFIDFVVAALAEDPTMHVYHYASYEPSALKRLMGRHGTREAEVDRLLRGEVLVDLYRVIKQSLLASRESYSLKDIEALYMGKRADAIAEAGSSIVAYERWIDTREQPILDEIAAYNTEDLRSTLLLRDWLEARRPDAEATFGIVVPRPSSIPSEPSVELKRWEQDIDDLFVRLAGGEPVVSPRWLLAHQLW